MTNPLHFVSHAMLSASYGGKSLTATTIGEMTIYGFAAIACALMTMPWRETSSKKSSMTLPAVSTEFVTGFHNPGPGRGSLWL
jgi:hypothetical protein